MGISWRTLKTASVLSLPARDCDLISLRNSLGIKRFNYGRTSPRGAGRGARGCCWVFTNGRFWAPVGRRPCSDSSCSSCLCHAPVTLTGSKIVHCLIFVGICAERSWMAPASLGPRRLPPRAGRPTAARGTAPPTAVPPSPSPRASLVPETPRCGHEASS